MTNYKHTVKSVFNGNVETYIEKYMDVSQYQSCLDVFCESIKMPEADILDIACGPGNLTRYVLHKLEDANITGIDFAPSMIESAKRNIQNAEFRLMEIQELPTLNTQYDGIVCGFLLPYLDKSTADQLIKHASQLSKPHSYLYLSTIMGDYKDSYLKKSSDGSIQLMTYLYDEELLEELLNRNGYNIFLKKLITSEKNLSSSDNEIIIIAQRSSI